ncbi:hypothetical protein GCM10028818_05340 [Spirosoma horti]
MKKENRGELVIKNTGILYIRMLLTMGISLYSTRMVLITLGVVDYGIYNLVAGIIIMLSFINSAMTASTQRYLSIYQGKNDKEKLKSIFSNSLTLHICIGLIIVVSLELIGILLFKNFLNIPTNRLSTAKIIYHFMSITVLFTVVSVPFSGSLNAHENMLWISIVNIIEVLLKFFIANTLKFVELDKLYFYGLAIATISFVSMILYAVYCLKKYTECTLRTYKDISKPLLKELASFAGWNLFGAACGVGRIQGLAIILNLFLGSAINAAYGIANQIAAQINFFSATMLQAMNPQIIKSEGQGDRLRMLRLSMMASKLGLFLLSIIAIPCIFEMQNILNIWLKNVPAYTVIFCDLILVSVMVNQLTIGLQTAFQAIGKIRSYQSIVGSILILNVPIAYFLLKKSFPVYSVLITNIIIELITCGLRIYFLKHIGGLSIKEFFNRVVLKELIPLISIIFTAYLINKYIDIDNRFILTTITCIITFSISIYFTGLCKDEKLILHNYISRNKIISKII